MPGKRRIAIIGAPMDLGAAGRRGVDMGPSAMRVASVGTKLADLRHTIEDLGNIPVVQPESVRSAAGKARYLREISESCSTLAKLVEKTMRDGAMPLVLGGDHSIAAGVVSGVAKHYRRAKQRIGVIWIDAHADMNTPATSPSGNVHGMPLAALMGRGPEELTKIGGYAPKVDPANVVLIGLRDVDEEEKRTVRETGVHAFTMRDIDELGMRTVMERAIAAATNGTAGFHLSLDLDSLDPEVAPGVGTPVAGGITYREAHLAMEMLADTGRMVSMDAVEVNPIIDEVNRTAIVAVELICSAFGKKILA
jgi:arginase